MSNRYSAQMEYIALVDVGIYSYSNSKGDEPPALNVDLVSDETWECNFHMLLLQNSSH